MDQTTRLAPIESIRERTTWCSSHISSSSINYCTWLRAFLTLGFLLVALLDFFLDCRDMCNRERHPRPHDPRSSVVRSPLGGSKVGLQTGTTFCSSAAITGVDVTGVGVIDDILISFHESDETTCGPCHAEYKTEDRRRVVREPFSGIEASEPGLCIGVEESDFPGEGIGTIVQPPQHVPELKENEYDKGANEVDGFGEDAREEVLKEAEEGEKYHVDRFPGGRGRDLLGMMGRW